VKHVSHVTQNQEEEDKDKMKNHLLWAASKPPLKSTVLEAAAT
jgi:hypothetical protein